MSNIRTSALGFSFLLIAGLLLSLPLVSAQPAIAKNSAEIANPASVNCVNSGGRLNIEKRPDGGEYGVCIFGDNRQCEEWALFRKDCPAGGLGITGYATPAARYCAITGGNYTVTRDGNTPRETGTCSFRQGGTCDAGDYFAGRCSPRTAQAGYDDPFAYCAAVGTIDSPDARYRGNKVPGSIVKGLIGLGIVTSDAPPDFQRNAVWRCVSGKVWVCHFGANLPCEEKADDSRTPTKAMEAYCRNHPPEKTIPAAVTGRATVYEWICGESGPEAGRRLLTADLRGYIAEFWHELKSETP